MPNEKGNAPSLLIARDQASPFEYKALSCRNGGAEGTSVQVLLMGRQADGTLTPVLVDAQGRLVTVAGV